MADFGYKKVSNEEKTAKVRNIFTSVAPYYDLMNDLMSFGSHRIWKDYVIYISQIRPEMRILDLACGTGDMAIRMQSKLPFRHPIIMCDTNFLMLEKARDRLIDKGLLSHAKFIQGDAENLPFESNSFDLITLSFGLRNVTDKVRALVSIYDKLKYGGKLMILEFSKLSLRSLDKVYNAYLFKTIPWLGKKIAKDESSYRYLVESIQMHPDQEVLKKMMEQAEFKDVDYLNLSGGISAIHRGYKL